MNLVRTFLASSVFLSTTSYSIQSDTYKKNQNQFYKSTAAKYLICYMHTHLHPSFKFNNMIKGDTKYRVSKSNVPDFKTLLHAVNKKDRKHEKKVKIDTNKVFNNKKLMHFYVCSYSCPQDVQSVREPSALLSILPVSRNVLVYFLIMLSAWSGDRGKSWGSVAPSDLFRRHPSPQNTHKKKAS